MKKIFAILISLLFVASVFGVAQTMAQVNCDCPCDQEYYKISKTSVHVGETFTLSARIGCLPGLKYDAEPWKFSEMIQYDETKDLVLNTETGWATATFKALRPGTLTITNQCAGECDGESIKITVTPKSLPMDWIMKKLGLGKYKN